MLRMMPLKIRGLQAGGLMSINKIIKEGEII
jgi:hypothetical protein